MQNPEPIVYICNALAYLCESKRTDLESRGIDPGEPPEMIGVNWVIETAKQLTKDPDDEEAGDDEEFPEITGLTIQVI